MFNTSVHVCLTLYPSK